MFRVGVEQHLHHAVHLKLVVVALGVELGLQVENQVQKFLGLLKLHSPMQIHCDQCKAMGDLLLVNTLPPQPRWRYNR
jgi:hypothetical protein